MIPRNLAAASKIFTSTVTDVCCTFRFQISELLNLQSLQEKCIISCSLSEERRIVSQSLTNTDWWFFFRMEVSENVYKQHAENHWQKCVVYVFVA
jgi:hypothetical protein